MLIRCTTCTLYISGFGCQRANHTYLKWQRKISTHAVDLFQYVPKKERNKKKKLWKNHPFVNVFPYLVSYLVPYFMRATHRMWCGSRVNSESDVWFIPIFIFCSFCLFHPHLLAFSPGFAWQPCPMPYEYIPRFVASITSRHTANTSQWRHLTGNVLNKHILIRLTYCPFFFSCDAYTLTLYAFVSSPSWSCALLWNQNILPFDLINLSICHK